MKAATKQTKPAKKAVAARTKPARNEEGDPVEREDGRKEGVGEEDTSKEARGEESSQEEALTVRT